MVSLFVFCLSAFSHARDMEGLEDREDRFSDKDPKTSREVGAAKAEKLPRKILPEDGVSKDKGSSGQQVKTLPGSLKIPVNRFREKGFVSGHLLTQNDLRKTGSFMTNNPVPGGVTQPISHGATTKTKKPIVLTRGKKDTWVLDQGDDDGAEEDDEIDEENLLTRSK